MDPTGTTVLIDSSLQFCNGIFYKRNRDTDKFEKISDIKEILRKSSKFRVKDDKKN
jgi:hypothetical protein